MIIKIIFALCLISTAQVFGDDAATLSSAAKHAFKMLMENDYKDFRKICSDDGVVVVRRAMDWDHSSNDWEEDSTVKSTIWSGKKGDDLLGFGGDKLQVGVWVDEEAEFSLGRADEEKAFHKVFGRFCEEIKDTYSHSLRSSLHLMDDWQLRNLGPAAGGTLLSNYDWYICFKKEKGIWKVWRMELAVH